MGTICDLMYAIVRDSVYSRQGVKTSITILREVIPIEVTTSHCSRIRIVSIFTVPQGAGDWAFYTGGGGRDTSVKGCVDPCRVGAWV